MLSFIIISERRPGDLKCLGEAGQRRTWRKMKGLATIRLATGAIRSAELHWYEALGIGRKG